ncbi:hypothetical protein CEXT_170801 [Caerostris extrusa]|uniref:Uncharacterized protein n=1 Tax=Caerostris extrusa TaxID=172846 RepID=A0AAV4XTC8_CAEEX|nr:hypothetical protein CEXT_170801 [Caerostris extrusa]
MRIAAIKFPNEVFLNCEYLRRYDVRGEYFNFKSILKSPSYEHLLMRIAASKLPFLPKRGVPQSHCISSVYLNIEDTMIEVNIFLILNPFLKVHHMSIF